jgi:pilus assembly protein Flp/PilA
MLSIIRYLNTYLESEEGASMIEYALIAALISIAAITIIPGIGTQLQTIFTNISTGLSGGTP